jgi:hypothetical protein
MTEFISASHFNVNEFMQSTSNCSICDLNNRSNLIKIPKSKSDEKKLKSSAFGDSSICGGNRFYINVKFENSNHTKLMYFHRDTLLKDIIDYLINSEVLRKLAFTNDQLISNEVSKSYDIVMSTTNTPWYLWHNEFYSIEKQTYIPYTISMLLLEYESISIQTLKIDMIQHSLSKRNEALELDLIAKKLEEIELIKQQEKDRIVENNRLADSVEYCKGDVVQYSKKEVSFDLARIIGVHLDDFPNIYYTIQPISLVKQDENTSNPRGNFIIIKEETNGVLSREIQTDKRRIQMVAKYYFLPVLVANGGLDLRIEYLSKQYFIMSVPPNLNLMLLRNYINQVTFGKIPLSNLIKQHKKSNDGIIEEKYNIDIEFKSKILKNEKKSLSSHKITNGARLSLIPIEDI